MITPGIFKANDIRGVTEGPHPEWDEAGAFAIVPIQSSCASMKAEWFCGNLAAGPQLASIATVRSTSTVSRKVVSSTATSLRGACSSERNTRHSLMFQATTTRMAIATWSKLRDVLRMSKYCAVENQSSAIPRPGDRFLAASGSLAGEIRIGEDFEFTDAELEEMLDP